MIAAVAAAAGLTCAATVNAATTGSGAPAPASRSTQPLPAVLQLGYGGHRIPRGFFGLSIEYNELQKYEAAGAPFLNLISMLRPRDGGPMLLRIGGKSADHALWEPTGTTPVGDPKLPRGVFKLSSTWLRDLRQLVQREHLRVMLDLNLAVHSTTMAVEFAKAVQQALPRGAISGMEVGNEPDEYRYQPPLSNERIPSTNPRTPLNWWRNYSPADYRRDYRSYARALKASLPGIALGAPDITSPSPPWLGAVTGLGRLNPRFLAIHRYATSNCWPSGSPSYPTISNLLAESASGGLAGSVTNAIALAHQRHMSLRLTEVNSVSCVGNVGIANTFASALWAPDALFSFIDTGVNGLTWHIRPHQINSPFQLARRGIAALPELYGLAVFAQMTHGPATVLASSLWASPQLKLRAWAVQHGGTISVLVINKGSRAANVSLRARGRSPAVVRRLSAPSIRATTGIRFAGRTIGPDGRWHGRKVESRLADVGGYYRLLVPGYSAAVVTL